MTGRWPLALNPVQARDLLTYEPMIPGLSGELTAFGGRGASARISGIAARPQGAVIVSQVSPLAAGSQVVPDLVTLSTQKVQVPPFFFFPDSRRVAAVDFLIHTG